MMTAIWTLILLVAVRILNRAGRGGGDGDDDGGIGGGE